MRNLRFWWVTGSILLCLGMSGCGSSASGEKVPTALAPKTTPESAAAESQGISKVSPGSEAESNSVSETTPGSAAESEGISATTPGNAAESESGSEETSENSGGAENTDPPVVFVGDYDYKGMYEGAFDDAIGRNGYYDPEEQYHWAGYTLCDLIPGEPLELAVLLQTGKFGGTLYFYQGEEIEPANAERPSVESGDESALKEKNDMTSDAAGEMVETVNSMSSGRAHFLGDIEIDRLMNNVVCTMDQGVVYRFPHKWDEMSYFRWDGTVFTEHKYYEQDTRGENYEEPDLNDYVDVDRIQTSLPMVPLDDDSVFRKCSREPETMTIVLDPGHGGSQAGAETVFEGRTIYEKDLNLTIAKYLKEELERYRGVRVLLTREGDEDVELKERTAIAAEAGADLLVSLHNNAEGDIAEYIDGCTVLAARDVWKTEMAQEEQELAASILRELSALGIADRGILLRESENDKVYENGEKTDYYAIIRNGAEMDVVSVLIEHSFMDSPSDYANYLSDDGALRRLAQADARGIAKYYHLVKKETGEMLSGPAFGRETLMLVHDGQAENNEYAVQVFGPLEYWRRRDELKWYSPEEWETGGNEKAGSALQ